MADPEMGAPDSPRSDNGHQWPAGRDPPFWPLDRAARGISECDGGRTSARWSWEFRFRSRSTKPPDVRRMHAQPRAHALGWNGLVWDRQRTLRAVPTGFQSLRVSHTLAPARAPSVPAQWLV